MHFHFLPLSRRDLDKLATEEIDYYAVLAVKAEATPGEIKTAYRQRSLKVHPDRNPDNPQAAALFHDLKTAFDILSDTTKRATFDALNQARLSRKARFQGLDNKRKAMAQDLERRENEFKKRSGEMNEKARDERSALERIKEDGRRRREEADKVNLDSINQGEQEQKRQAKELKKQKLAESNSGALPLGPLDTTLKLKWLRSLHPTLITPTALSTFLGTTLSVFDPEIDTIALSAKFLANTAKGKYGSGVVAFKSLRAAMRLIEATSQLVEGETRKGWEGFEVTWASGSPPECLGLTPEAVPAAKLSPAMFVDSDEDRILAQLRARERAKIIADLERQEAEES